MRNNIICATAFFVAISSVSAIAAVIRVPADQPTIQAGINAAANGDTVLVASGTYTISLNPLGKAIVIASESGAGATTISGVGVSGRLFRAISGETRATVLSGFTLSGSSDGAIQCYNSSPTISSCRIVNNTASGGAAAFISGSSSSPLFVDNLMWDNNGSSGGGAVTVSWAGAPVFLRNHFHRNQTSDHGAAIFSAGSATVARHNVFSANSCSHLGTAYLATSEARDSIINNTFYANGPGECVLALWYSTKDVALNNIFAFNHSTAILQQNCAVYSADYNNFYANIGGAYSGLTPGPGDLFANPEFVDTAAGDFHLALSSPCIDEGHPSVEFDDADGSRNDMGAFPVMRESPYIVKLGFAGEDRLHVVNNIPTIVWGYRDTLATQSEFEVEVGIDNDWAVAEMWASGAVASADTAVVYAGNPLVDGMVYQLRARVSNGTTWSEWWDLMFRMNSAPGAPNPLYPIDGADVNATAAVLVVGNSSEGDSDELTYDFEVYSDAGLTTLITSGLEIAETPSQTQYGPLIVLPIGSVWWRARANDGYEYSDWSVVADFEATPTAVHRVPSEQATIQQAIAACGPGDTVLVAPGTYSENLTFQGKNIILLSEEGPALTTIRPADSLVDNIVIENSTQCVIEGFTIRDVDYFASVAVECVACNLTVRNNIFTNNTEASVWIRSGGSVFAEGNEFVGNASRGDAATLLCRDFNRAIAINNVFRDNTSEWGGGGIHFSTGNFVEARGNLIFRNGNTTDFGGGIYASSVDTVTLYNNTIDSNFAGTGGGMWLRGILHLDMQNNIVTRNANDGINAAGTFTTLAHEYSDVWGNGGADYAGLPLATGTSISMDPIFTSIGGMGYGRALWYTSPCRNAGNPATEFNDPDGSRSDMGALPFSIDLPLAGDINLGQEEPFHVVSGNPRLYWSFLDTAYSQAGFEMQVGTDDDWSTAEVWSSGQVVSPDTSIVYAGAPLQDGETYHLRLRLNNGTSWGIWIGSMFRMNSVPPPPLSILPADGDTVHYLVIRSVVENPTDPENDTLTYIIELYEDAALTTLRDLQVIAGGDGQTSALPWQSLTPGLSYWWRARVHDGFEYSTWSDVMEFYARWAGAIPVPFEFATISSAVAAAGPYDTIRVAPGTYYENIDFAGETLTLLSDSGASRTTLIPQVQSVSHIYLGNPAASQIEISGFTFMGGQGGSMIPLTSDNAFIHDNIFRNFGSLPTGAAVLHVSSGSAIISRNMFLNNDGSSCIGIYGGQATIINNTIDRNHGGIAQVNGSAIVRNNIVTGSEEFGIYGASLNADYNCVFGNYPNYQQYNGGSNDVIASPMYFDALSGDFRLQAGSPCINAGDPDPVYKDVDGSRNDMGAVAAVCDCGCHSDPLCDHATDILDVIFVIGNAFRGLEELNDDFCFSHSDGSVGGRTDVNCSGYTDIVDVVRIIDVAFRGADPSSILCASCDLP